MKRFSALLLCLFFLPVVSADDLYNLSVALEQIYIRALSEWEDDETANIPEWESDDKIIEEYTISQEARDAFKQDGAIRKLVEDEFKEGWQNVYKEEGLLTNFILSARDMLVRKEPIKQENIRIQAIKPRLSQEKLDLLEELKGLPGPLATEALLTDAIMRVNASLLVQEKKIEILRKLFSEVKGETAQEYAENFNKAFMSLSQEESKEVKEPKKASSEKMSREEALAAVAQEWKKSEGALVTLELFADKGSKDFFSTVDKLHNAAYGQTGLAEELLAKVANVSVEKIKQEPALVAEVFVRLIAPKFYDASQESLEHLKFLTELTYRPKILVKVLLCPDCIEILGFAGLNKNKLVDYVEQIEQGQWDSLNKEEIHKKFVTREVYLELVKQELGALHGALSALELFADKGISEFFSIVDRVYKAPAGYTDLVAEFLAKRAQVSIEKIKQEPALVAEVFVRLIAPKFYDASQESLEHLKFLTELTYRPKILVKVLLCPDCIETLGFAGLNKNKLVDYVEQIEQGQWDKLNEEEIHKKFVTKETKRMLFEQELEEPATALAMLELFADNDMNVFFIKVDELHKEKYGHTGLVQDVFAQQLNVPVDKLKENSDLIVKLLFHGAAPQLYAMAQTSPPHELFLKELIRKPKLLVKLLQCSKCVEILSSLEINQDLLGSFAIQVEKGEWDKIDNQEVVKKFEELKVTYQVSSAKA